MCLLPPAAHILAIAGNSGDIWLPAASFCDPPVDVTAAHMESCTENTSTFPPQNISSAKNVDTEKQENDSVSQAPLAKEPHAEKASVNSVCASTSKTGNAGEAALSDEAATSNEAFEKGVIAGLQEAILARMEKNGYVTDQMRQDVYNNVHHDSLINWIKSF